MRQRIAILAAAAAFPVITAAADLPTSTAAMETVHHEQQFDGVLEAVHQSTVSAETSGRIVELPYDVDDYVPKGGVIVRFRDTEQQARLKQAQAGLEEARAQLRQAASEYERMKSLLEKHTVSQSTFDRAESAWKSAGARVEAAQAELNQAKEQLEHTVVRAPYAGVVTARHVEVGEMAQPGTPLMTGLSLEHMRAVVDVPQQFIQALREHGEARVLTPDGESLEATAVRIFPYADESTHTFRVRATLPEGQHGAYPGMLVKVAFTTGTEQVLLVPERAVVRRSELTAVYVLDDDGRVAFRLIRTGHGYPNGTEVLAGIQPGERVVLDPVAAGIAYKQQTGESEQ